MKEKNKLRLRPRPWLRHSGPVLVYTRFRLPPGWELKKDTFGDLRAVKIQRRGSIEKMEQETTKQAKSQVVVSFLPPRAA